MKSIKEVELTVPVQIIAGSMHGYSAMGQKGELECKVILLYDERTQKLQARIGAGTLDFIQKCGNVLSFDEAKRFFTQQMADVSQEEYTYNG